MKAKEIRLDMNKIQFLPPSIGSLPQLEVLSVDSTVSNLPSAVHSAGQDAMRKFLAALEFGSISAEFDGESYGLSYFPLPENYQTHLTKIRQYTMHACTHAHMHARMHACMHARMHAHSHSHMDTWTHGHMDTCTHAHAHTCMHTMQLA